jgi:hypothetical protein
MNDSQDHLTGPWIDGVLMTVPKQGLDLPPETTASLNGAGEAGREKPLNRSDKELLATSCLGTISGAGSCSFVGEWLDPRTTSGSPCLMIF